MLQISHAQMAALEAQQKRKNAQALAQQYRERYAPIFCHYSNAQLAHWVLRQYDYLQSLGIHTQPAVNQLMALFAVFGEQFERCEQNDWALDILTSPNHDNDGKVFLLEHAINQRY